MPRLPAEIIHSLITTYFSSTTDSKTLKALSLTHSLILHSARSVLFENIRLSRHPSDDGVRPFLCHAFSTLLQRSPGIAKYVKKLIIIEGTILNPWYGDKRYWVSSEDEDLPFILRMVSLGRALPDVEITPSQTPTANGVEWDGIGLRKLEILGVGKGMMDWNKLSPELRMAFSDVMKMGRLEDIRLLGVNNFPLHHLRNCLTLRNVCFGWMDIQPQPEQIESEGYLSEINSDSVSEDVQHASTIAERKPKIRYLDLCYEHNGKQGTTLIEHLVAPGSSLDISTLEHIVLNGDSYHGIQTLLMHCADELRTLEIRNNEYPIPEPPTHISLTPLSSLNNLCLLIPIIDWDNIHPDPIPWLQHLLSTLRVPQVGKSQSQIQSLHQSQSYNTNTITGMSSYNTTLSNPNLQSLHIIFDIDRMNLLNKINTEHWKILNDELSRLLQSSTSSSSESSLPNSPSSSSSNQFQPLPKDIEIKLFMFTDMAGFPQSPTSEELPLHHLLFDNFNLSSSPSPPFLPPLDYNSTNDLNRSSDSSSTGTSIGATTAGNRNDTSKLDSGGVNGGKRKGNGKGEDLDMRQYLAKFLPLLEKKEGNRLFVYRTNHIPRL